MARLDHRSRELFDHIAHLVRTTRAGLGWSQRRLARASGCSQSAISRLERGRGTRMSLVRLLRILRALGVEPQLVLTPPRIDRLPVRDRAHARCVGAVAQRLRRAGFLVATEVEVGGARWRGFIDVLAMHPAARLLLVIEVKTGIDDLGAIDRQLESYVEAAWEAARSRGWRPRGATGILLALATDEIDRVLKVHRRLIDAAFPLRYRDLQPLVDAIPHGLPPRGARGVAMIDPATRRRAWLLSTTIDGRRTAAAYADRREFLVGRAA
jgi:transcriptional regulator with XRE-family HTH domain